MAEDAPQMIEQATQAVQSARYEDALALLDRALASDPDSSEICVLRGVSLSRLGRTDEATQAFETAISLAPHAARSYYNFAVHLYPIDKVRALEMAREAVRLQRDHGAAADLVARLERETGALHEPPPISTPFSSPAGDQPQVPPESAPGGESAFSAPPTAGYYRGSYQDAEQPLHSIRFIEKMGFGWDIVGWLLTLLEAGSFVYSILEVPKIWAQVSNGMNPNNPFGSGQQVLGNPVLTSITLLITGLIMLWLILDISDRRGNWTWLVPFFLACCCGTHWIVTAIYLFSGRRSR